jgi:apolipoprotein N-acyltransferase
VKYAPHFTLKKSTFERMLALLKSQRYALSILSGLLMVVSFPFTGSLTFLVFVAWVPLLYVEQNIAEKRYRSGKMFIHAYLTFFIYNIGTTWWVANASEGGAMMAIGLNALFMALVFQLYHFSKRTLKLKFASYTLPLFWVAFEYLHMRWEMSWPWLTVGNTFSIVPSWVQWYALTGVFGGTLWVLYINILLFDVLRAWKNSNQLKIKKFAGYCALAFVVPLAISMVQYYTYQDQGRKIEVVAVQPNIDPYHEKFTGSIEGQMDKMLSLADEKVTKNTTLVIFPETAISWSFYEGDFSRLPIYPMLIERMKKWDGAQLLTGASTAQFFEKKNSRASMKINGGPGYIESYNSSLILREKGNYEFLHKSKLVPGVEVLPFSDWFPFLEEWSINNGGTSGTLGVEKEPKVLKDGDFCFASVICYESIYGDFVRQQCAKGAEAIFILTNDGWWKDTPGYKQHCSFASLRAIENRRSIARSANTGISCFVNQRGDITQKTAWWKPAAIRSHVALNKEKTVYMRTGDLLAKVGLSLSFSILMMSIYRRFKPAKETTR